MPFYSHDNLTCFLYSALVEELDDDAICERFKKTVSDAIDAHGDGLLREVCDDQLDALDIDIRGDFRYAVLNSVDYELLKKLLKEHRDDMEIDVDDVESPNQFPYKKCAACSERKSCGSYTACQEWLCESCAVTELDPEGKKVECSDV